MDNSISFDTPLPSDFKRVPKDDPLIKAFVEKLKEQSLADGLPPACGRYWFHKDFIAIIPSFLGEHCHYFTHFELYKSDEGWFWGVHFEPYKQLPLDITNQDKSRLEFDSSYKTYALLDCFHYLFPVEEESEVYGWCNWHFDNGCLFFKPNYPESFAEAIQSFGQFYKFVVETMRKADIKVIKEKFPKAAPIFESLRRLTEVEFKAPNDSI